MVAIMVVTNGVLITGNTGLISARITITIAMKNASGLKTVFPATVTSTGVTGGSHGFDFRLNREKPGPVGPGFFIGVRFGCCTRLINIL